jgi:hypothetical protein
MRNGHQTVELSVLVDTVRFSGRNDQALVIRIESGTFVALRSLVFFAESDARSLSLTALESDAFKRSEIESIFIPRTIEVIGSNCFASNELLSSISFESDCMLKYYGNSAFAYCYSQAAITVPRVVDKIWVNSFLLCRSLLSICFEQNCELKEIENGSFSYCDQLRNIIVPKSVTIMNVSAFW